MKRVLLLLLTAVSLTAAAQSDFKFGYLSYQAAIEAMPEYATAQTSLTQLKTQYAAEQQRVETEFNAKYEEFLDGQKDFPPTILQKRQTELQELLDRNIAFKQQSQQLLAQAEEEALKPLRTRLNTALAKVGLSEAMRSS